MLDGRPLTHGKEQAVVLPAKNEQRASRIGAMSTGLAGSSARPSTGMM
jgi:hypothetical protein